MSGSHRHRREDPARHAAPAGRTRPVAPARQRPRHSSPEDRPATRRTAGRHAAPEPVEPDTGTGTGVRETTATRAASRRAAAVTAPVGGTGARSRASRRRGTGARRTRRRQLPFWQELPLLVVVAIVLALVIKTFLVQAFYIPSGSMEQTLDIRDRVLVNKVVYHFRSPRRGEIVVFNGVDSWTPESSVPAPSNPVSRAAQAVGSALGVGPSSEKDFVKRVIGLPGDVVQCCDSQGRVTVNGKALDEPYVYQNTPIGTRAFGPVQVPAGRLWVMGDHRDISADSRVHVDDQWQGTIPENHVIGRAFLVVWPPSRIGGLPVPGTFSTVPKHPKNNLPGQGLLLPTLVVLPTATAARRRNRSPAGSVR